MHQFHLITDRRFIGVRPLSEVVEQAVQGGVTHVQLREKSTDLQTVTEIAMNLKRILDKHGIPLIINDYVSVAKEVDAAGVHVGQDDISCIQARQILGPSKIVGLSVTNFDEAVVAQAYPVDYLGVGPIFVSQTKPDAAPPIGLEGLAKIKNYSRHTLVAIGGINHKHAKTIFKMGVGIAIVSAICAASNPQKAAEGFIKASSG